MQYCFILFYIILALPRIPDLRFGGNGLWSRGGVAKQRGEISLKCVWRARPW